MISPDLGTLMDHYLLHQQGFRDSERTRRKAQEGTDQTREFYASELGKCLRSQYLQSIGVPRKDTIDAKTRRTFAWGDHVEGFARTVYQRLGLVVPPKNPRLSYGSLVARGDIILRFPPENVDDIPPEVTENWSPEWVEVIRRARDSVPADFEGYVWDEIKSTKSTAMPYLIKEGPRFAHKIQVGASMFIARQDPDQLPFSVDVFQVTYVGKDAVGTLRFPSEESWATEAESRWRLLDTATSAQDLPCECECSCANKWMKAFAGTTGHVRPNDERAYAKHRMDSPFCWTTVCAYWSGDYDGGCCDPALERSVA